MYEIWLMMNIVWELAMGWMPWLAVALGLWALVWLAVALRPPGRWRPAVLAGLIGATLAALLAATLTPAATRSSLSMMGYWVDWANLAGIVLACAVAAGLIIMPLAALWTRQRPA